MAEVLVLGAGMVGVSSALALQQAGYDVVLVDKSAPGNAASFGNAGIIQAEAAEPYALPQDLPTLLSYAFGRSNDVVWELSAAIKMSPALWHYNHYSKPKRHRPISNVYSRMTASATDDHAPFIAAANAERLISKEGLVMLYRSQSEFDKAAKNAERITSQFGIQKRLLAGVDYRIEEPALRKTPAGAIHWTDSWSCSDPGELTKHYAQLFSDRGGKIAFGDANSLEQTKNGWQLNECNAGKIEAQHAVVCLGHESPSVLKKLGYTIPMIYKRGYHGHFHSSDKPRVPFLDVQNGILAASMTQGLRLTTGAALVNTNSPAEPIQLARGLKAMKELLDIGARVDEPQWYGTRPCLPDMMPLVGAAPSHKGLWFNFGHGHQGFTLGPTTARLLLEQMQDKPSDIAKTLAPQQRQWLKG